MTKNTLCLAGALAALAIAAPSARAATFGEWLAYCAGGSADIDSKIKRDSLTTCGLDEGVKSACSVLGGTPWTCSTPAAKTQEPDSCDELNLNFAIGAEFAMPLGWKVSGNANATYKRMALKSNINVCQASPVLPTPIGNGGDYSAESGDISFIISFKLDGDIKVTTPPPASLTVNVTAKVGCSRSTQGHYFKKANVNSCGSPTPSPSPTTPPASPTPGGTPSPTPGGTPSPTPGGTPSPTPGGTPSPTPGGTPSPTPGGTPPATPPPASPTPVRTPSANPVPMHTTSGR